MRDRLHFHECLRIPCQFAHASYPSRMLISGGAGSTISLSTRERSSLNVGRTLAPSRTYFPSRKRSKSGDKGPRAKRTYVYCEQRARAWVCTRPQTILPFSRQPPGPHLLDEAWCAPWSIAPDRVSPCLPLTVHTISTGLIAGLYLAVTIFLEPGPDGGESLAGTRFQ